VTDHDRDHSPSERPLRGLLDDILSFCAYFWTFLSFRSQQRINKTLKVVYSPERKTQVLENDDRPNKCEYCFRMGQINYIFGYLEVFW
jgi:hypothetical protein